jgi:DNA-binding CsgD family transcriptional regulator
MFHIDIRTAFLGYIIINIVSAVMIGSLYLQINKKFPKSFLIFLSFIMSALGNLLLFFRNIFVDWISIIVGNSIVISSTVVLFIGLEQFVNKKGVQIQNYFLIIVFVLVHSYFTFIKPDINIRNLDISIIYVLLSAQIAWLMLIRAPLKTQKITRGIGYVFCIIFIIQIIRIITITFSTQQIFTYYNLDNSEAFFLFSYQIIFIILAYSISLMYNKSLILDVAEQEKEILNLAKEKLQLELEIKKKEVTQKELKIASMKEVNRNIIDGVKSNLVNLSVKGNSNINDLIKTLHNSTNKTKIWNEFDNRFKEANSDFYLKLTTDYPTLSTNEIRVACLVSQNYKTKEIAEILQRSAKTVENIRGLIRKKLNLQMDENLTSFLISIK